MVLKKNRNLIYRMKNCTTTAAKEEHISNISLKFVQLMLLTRPWRKACRIWVSPKATCSFNSLSTKPGFQTDNLLSGNRSSTSNNAFVNWIQPQHSNGCVLSRNTDWRGRLSTPDLLIKVACFVTKVHNFSV